MKRTPLYLFFALLVIYILFANLRLLGPSKDAHFIYLADAFLHGQLELLQAPPHKNDWASYEELTLKGKAKDRYGAQVRGVFLRGKSGKFKTLRGARLMLHVAEIQKRTRHYFVSFPPLPALLMTPLVWCFGKNTSDVWFTLFFATLNGVLCWLLLGRLRRIGYSKRTPKEDLWLCILFTLGSAHLWCAVLGKVWYTALIIGVTFHLLFLYFAFDMRRPVLAGLCLAAAFTTRASLVVLALFFYAQLIWPINSRLSPRERIKRSIIFSIPPLLIGCCLLWYNFSRFESYIEFGHTYLSGGQIHRIQKYGLFHPIFLKKNMIAAFLLMPSLTDTAPFFKVSWHGMCVQLSSPALMWSLFSIWPISRGFTYVKKMFKSSEQGDLKETDLIKREEAQPVKNTLFILSVVLCILFSLILMYQNTGWVQYSWRFILDMLPLIIVIIALGEVRLGSLFKCAVLFGVLINAIGAGLFNRAGFSDVFVNLPTLFPH